jgi:membrane-bound ClpP family serine protease
VNELFALATAHLPAVICLVLGIVLTGIEIFMPGFGVFGIVGITLLGIGIFLGASTAIEALIIVLIVLIVIGALVFFALRSAARGRIFKSPLVLKESLDHEAGYSATEEMSCFLGREGVTITPLRPAGMADFDGVKLDVVSESAYVEKDVPVRIIQVDGRRIVVRPL